MKKANERFEQAMSVRLDREKAREQMTYEYIENEIEPAIERAAADGKTSVLVEISKYPHLRDFIVNVYREQGYGVSVKHPTELNIVWEQ